MALMGEVGVVDLGGRDAIDTPLSEIQAAIENTLGHGVEFGIEGRDSSRFDFGFGITGATDGSSYLLAYSKLDSRVIPGISEFHLGSGMLLRRPESMVIIDTYDRFIGRRNVATDVDPPFVLTDFIS